jgi:hypothetical protein
VFELGTLSAAGLLCGSGRSFGWEAVVSRVVRPGLYFVKSSASVAMLIYHLLVQDVFRPSFDFIE